MPSAKSSHSFIEECWILVGQHRGLIWNCRRLRKSRGDRISVRFDGQWILRREEHQSDVVGFLHTHPNGPNGPSIRDVRTMRAWCSAFGKNLLCAISSPEGLFAYRFDAKSSGVRLRIVEAFPRGVLIGVD